MGDLNYHHLRYFWAVAREGSLTAAARRLRVSQSSLSVQIQKLEEQLGHELFERQGRQLVLTEAGRIALDFAQSIFATGDELRGTLDELAEGRRVFRVGGQSTLSRNFQIQFLEPLVGLENVEVVVRSGALDELLRSLADFHLDVVLSNLLPPRTPDIDWVAHEIAEQPVSLIGRPDAHATGGDLSTLLSSARLVLPSRASSIRAGFDALVQRLGVTPRVAAQVDDMAMMRLVARQHRGLTVVPPIVVCDELEAGILVEVARLPDLRETFFAVTVARRFPNPLLRYVLPR